MKYLVLGALFAFTTSARAGGSFPADLPLPSLAKANAATLSEHTYDELDAPPAKKKARGHLVRGYLSYVPEGSSPPAAKVWSAWQPLLAKAGWKTAADDGNTHYLTKGTALLAIGLGDYQEPLITIVTAETKPTKLTLSAPGRTMEKVSNNEDYPWLPAFPGAKLDGTGVSSTPMLVSLPGEKEPTVVSMMQINKTYTPPPTLSKLETEAAYGAALKAAGWDVYPGPVGEGVLSAHFTKNGRDIWLSVGRAADDSNTGLRYTVADTALDDWESTIDRKCKLQLVGVRFDFDKATLRPESALLLEKVKVLILKRPALTLEVSGHTDNIGDGPYNAKLSQSRAETVVKWLVDHKVPAKQLTAKGYGKDQPIADNQTDVGRAQNRRVQLSCVK